MKTITKLGLVALLLLFVGLFTQTYAQSHNIKARNCKYWKEPPRMGSGAQVTDFSVCKVCSEKKDKEEAAKRAEDKRRHEALVAKTKAENERKAKEDAEKQRLQNEKNKPVNATIVMSPNTGKSTPAKTEEKKDVKMEEGYFYITDFPNSLDNFILKNDGTNDKFLSKGFLLNGKTVFVDKFRRCYGKVTHEWSSYFNFPKNIGVVELIERNKLSENHYTPIFELITTSGERILKDNKISYIEFLGNNNFLIYRGPIAYSSRGIRIQKDTRESEVFHSDAYIYNIKSKKQIFIKGYDYDFGVVNNATIIAGGDGKYCQGDDQYLTADLTRREDEGVIKEYHYYCYSNNTIKIIRKTTSSKGTNENITLLETIPLN